MAFGHRLPGKSIIPGTGLRGLLSWSKTTTRHLTNYLPIWGLTAAVRLWVNKRGESIETQIATNQNEHKQKQQCRRWRWLHPDWWSEPATVEPGRIVCPSFGLKLKACFPSSGYPLFRALFLKIAGLCPFFRVSLIQGFMLKEKIMGLTCAPSSGYPFIRAYFI